MFGIGMSILEFLSTEVQIIEKKARIRPNLIIKWACLTEQWKLKVVF